MLRPAFRFSVFVLTLNLISLQNAHGDCASLASQLSALASRDPSLPPRLSNLQKAVRDLNKGEESHELRVVNGKGHLKIGYLEREDFTFLKSMVSAIQEGSINDLNIGPVIGPAVVPMLPHFVRINPARQPIRIYGTLSPKFLIQKLKREGKVDEAERLKQTLRQMGAVDGCRRILGVSNLDDCTWMSYEIDTAKSKNFKWSPDRDEDFP